MGEWVLGHLEEEEADRVIRCWIACVAPASASPRSWEASSAASAFPLHLSSVDSEAVLLAVLAVVVLVVLAAAVPEVPEVLVVLAVAEDLVVSAEDLVVAAGAGKIREGRAVAVGLYL